MNVVPKYPGPRLGLGALVGWAALLLAWTIYAFWLSCDPDFAPEIGFAATYVISGAFLSGFYFLAFIFFGCTCFFLLSSRLTNPVVRMLAGAALFGVTMPLLGLAVWTPFDWSAAVLGSIAGAACFSVLKPRRLQPAPPP